ncbi:MAG: hypothetical protein LBN33_05810 [Desulfovibrio sp.]|jgi:predicted ABC-type ATPase|nr:hypothetical protein [Desulfovibrio sp.]
MDGKITALIKSPKILVFAGPNGSGKSTISDAWKIVGLYINADEIKKRRDCTVLDAALEAEKLRELCLYEVRDFTFETVLSTERNLDLLARAKSAGFYIESVFVLTADAELNVFRVRSRVIGGGHDVPAEKIRARYRKSLANIHKLIALSDECYVIDNTEEPFVIYAKDATGQYVSENRYWPADKLKTLLG